MDSKKARKGRKSGKKSEKYRNLARIRWDKAARLQNNTEAEVSASNEQTIIDDVQESITDEAAAYGTSKDVSINKNGDDEAEIVTFENEIENAADSNDVLLSSSANMHDIFDEESQVVSELNSTLYDNSSSVIESCLYSGVDDMDNASSKNSSGPCSSDNSWTSSSSSSNESLPESSSSEYCPTPMKKARFHTFCMSNLTSPGIY